MPASRSPSRYGVAVFQRYILQRPFWPSGGYKGYVVLCQSVKVISASRKSALPSWNWPKQGYETAKKMNEPKEHTLLKPLPSWAFAMTASPSLPPRPKLSCWKFPLTSSKPYLKRKVQISRWNPSRKDRSLPVVQIVNHIAGEEQLGNGGIDVGLGNGHRISTTTRLWIIFKVEFGTMVRLWTIVV